MEICDANLVLLTYVGSEPKMLFKNVPRLFEVSFGSYYYWPVWCVKCIISMVSWYLPRLEILHLRIDHGG